MAEVVTLPKLGMDMQEGTFINWVKKVGDAIKVGDVIAEVESDKATIEIESTANGVITETLVEAGQTVAVGAPIARVGDSGAVPSAAPKTEAVPVVIPATNGANNGKSAPQAVAPSTSVGAEFPAGAKASPLARRIAEEKGIDLIQIQGTGPGGRITKADVEGFQPGTATATAAPIVPAAATARPPAQALVAPTGPGVTEIPLTRMRQRIGSRMVESKQNVPHFYVTTEVDMGPALELRKQINANLPDEQKVSVNDMVVKAVALSLRQYPNLNSHYYGDKIVRYEYINVGIAVALETGGLLNVVAKDADVTAISRLAQKNKEMIAAARTGKVRPDDMEGSTFTVSNLGPYDVDTFVAIITPPEAGIVAIGSAKQVPVVINGELKIGTRMKCTLSADHRVTDGAEGAQFMQEFKQLLENPMRLLV